MKSSCVQVLKKQFQIPHQDPSQFWRRYDLTSLFFPTHLPSLSCSVKDAPKQRELATRGNEEEMQSCQVPEVNWKYLLLSSLPLL